MQKILVTGATGFVGRRLVQALQAQGYAVLCAVSTPDASLHAPQAVVGRLEDMHDWAPVLQGVDIVIHLAAMVHVMDKKVPSEAFCKVNTVATTRLAQQALLLGVRRFIFLSSIKVNGEFTQPGMPFTEENAQAITSPYALSKWYAERELLAVSKQHGMDVVILRPPLVFGPGVKANFLKMLEWIHKGYPLPFAGIHNARHFIFIDNLVSAIQAVLHAPRAANQVYLVADNEAWSLSDLVQAARQAMGLKARLFSVPGLRTLLAWLGLQAISLRLLGSLEVSSAKIKQDLGWTPPITSVEGLRKTVSWYLAKTKPQP